MKRSEKSKAADLYVSPLFKMNLAYARTFKPDAIFILSAKYGLLELDQEIETYNQTLNYMKSSEIKTWADEVFEELSLKTDIPNTEFIFLAGERYRKFLIPHMPHFQVPMQGLGIGKQLQYLKNKLTA